MPSQAQAAQARGGQDDGVQSFAVELAQPRVDVAPDGDDLEVGAKIAQLGLPAQRTRAHPGALWQCFQRRERALGDQGVAGILATRNRPQREPLGKLGGEILQAVHGQIDGPVEESLLDLFNEQALVVGRQSRQRGRRQLVARRADGLHRNVESRLGLLEQSPDQMGLGKGQPAAPGADDELLHSESLSRNTFLIRAAASARAAG